MDANIAKKLGVWRGRHTTEQELAEIRRVLPWAPEVILELMATYPVANAKVTIDEVNDESGLGVAMRWLTSSEIIDESLNAYPGIVAARYGYLPIGACLQGTGDPYFVRMNDARTICRIPHTAVTNGDDLDEDAVERVSDSLTAFLAIAVEYN